MARFDLNDEEWAVIAPLLPKQSRSPQRKVDRQILNGFFYILRTGHHGVICRNVLAPEPQYIIAM
ncbi:MAG: transposase [Hyphomicrobiales bacterium]|nr:transposase [Hyphomicrobiales bacterium]